MTAFLEAAFSCHRYGFSVIPIVPRDKKPLIMWEKYQSTPATEEELKAWWAKWPDANVGIVTGEISGLVVIDLDSVEAKDKFKALINGYDLSAVPRSRTGKGWQLFFKHPGVTIPNRAAIIPGLDVRGDGGYVVAPPSIHPSGKVYKWEVPLTGELPELPVDLFKLISSPTGNGSESGYRERFDTAQALAGVPEGQRDETLFRLACKLRAADVPQDMAGKLILEAATNCQPPFPEREALAKVENVYRRYVAGDGRPEKHEPIVEIQESDEKKDPLANDAVAFPEAAWRGLFGQEKVILEILKPRRRMWRRDLQQAASKKKINGKLFGEVLRSLEANGHVKQGESESLSGQKRPFVEYIPGNREHLSSSETREKVLGVPDASPGGEL